MIEQPVITSGQGPYPKTIDDYTIDLLMTRLNSITKKYPISNPDVANTRKGKHGEAIKECAVENYLWSQWRNDYDLIFQYPSWIQRGIDARFEIDKRIVYIEAKNWDSYKIYDGTYNSEILGRFKKYVTEASIIKIFLINNQSISISHIWDNCCSDGFITARFRIVNDDYYTRVYETEEIPVEIVW